MTTFSEQFPIVFQALNIGFLQTLKLFFVTLIGAIPLGLIISFGSMSRWSPLGFLRPYLKNLPKDGKLTWWQKTQLWFAVDFRPIRLIVRFVIWVVRGTPLMLQLLAVTYGPYYLCDLPVARNKLIPVVIAFAINYAAYFAEIYRGGIESMPVGQYEAAEVLGYTKAQTFIHVILPQVFKRIMPSITNEVVTLVKDTSMAFTVSYQEMFTIGKQIANSETSFTPFLVAGVFYFAFNAVVDLVMGKVEKRMDYYK